jgi:hypothetical protein
MKLTCQWHEAIKLNYNKTGMHVIFVIRVSKHYRLADSDVTFLSVHSQLLVWGEMTPHSRTYTEGVSADTYSAWNWK